LDLACGTGQIAFGLASSFAEVWAVDQEPEAVEFARAKALRDGVDNVRWIAGRAEDVDADGYFQLVTIGNAFHRLQRRVIAASAMRWLVPGGHLALLWSNSPWDGSREWQRVLADTVSHWTREAAATERVPANLSQHLAEEPHTTVLATAGFTIVGVFDFETPYEWSVETLTGFMYSTSVLSQQALGRNVEAFERDLRARLLDVEPEGVFREEISFSYTLARRP
jgi:ubiquinone/menaquinone biosynthesis C-methylase UbiE